MSFSGQSRHGLGKTLPTFSGGGWEIAITGDLLIDWGIISRKTEQIGLATTDLTTIKGL